MMDYRNIAYCALQCALVVAAIVFVALACLAPAIALQLTVAR